MIEMLMIRHGESQRNSGITTNLDSAMTDTGMRQTCLTAAWLSQNFCFNGFKGIVSPYLRTLQTASIIGDVCNVDFTVNDGPREYRFNVGEGTMHIPNRSLAYDNHNWPVAEWDQTKEFPAEDIDALIARGEKFLNDLRAIGDKFVVVSHATPIVLLGEMLIGKTKDKIKEALITTAEHANEVAKKSVLTPIEKHIYMYGVKNCGITWIKDGQPLWFSKVVYE